MAKTKFEKASEAFMALSLEEKIDFHQTAGGVLKDEIDSKNNELRQQIEDLETVKETIK